MKAHAADATTVPTTKAVSERRALDFLALTKPRLNMLVLITTLGGLYLASPSGVPVLLVAHTLIGTALVAGGAAALNQVWERETDARMRRTSNRPLPRGRLSVGESIWFGIGLSAAGLADLALATNPTAAIVAAVTSISYVLIYTPLKTRTSLATLVGAVPGALPPVIGWAAASGVITLPALVLFGIVFFWQMPHFLAIAWMYRDDYARAGIRMLPVVEPDLDSTARRILWFSVVLVPLSLAPKFMSMAGNVYLIGAILLSAFVLYTGLQAMIVRTMPSARRVLLASIVYLPILYGLLAFDS